MGKSSTKAAGVSRRRALQGLAGLGVAGSHALTPQLQAAVPGKSDRIRQENARVGTREWMLDKTKIDPASKYRCPWIEGYVSRASVRAGETLSFHVSTRPSSPFTIDLFRLGYYGGKGGRLVQRLGDFDGGEQPDPPVESKRLRQCQWEACHELTIPSDWVSGVYVGKLTAEEGGWQSYVIFVVRDEREVDFLLQCSDHTWQAYNRWPSQFSLYDDGNTPWHWGDEVAVSFRRPYGKYCQIVDAPLSTGSGEFFLWEFPMAYWMESLGYDVSYVSNRDTHDDPEGLLRCRGFLSVGHDEYWTNEMFANVQAAVGQGVSVGFFSGNAVCGRVAYLAKNEDAFERVGVFGPPGGTREFSQMSTLAHERPYAHELIGAHSTGPVTGGADWICSKPEHWIYEGTGMKQGDRIPGVIGWEYHGDPAPLPGLEIVAEGPTQSNPGELNGGYYTGTVYPGPRGNFVFNAATCWWADGLSEPPGYCRPKVYTEPQGPDRRVQRMTQNVLERMLRGGKRPHEEWDRLTTCLSREGCGRATGYAEANKIVTWEDKTHVAWLDSPREGFRVRLRSFDRRAGRWDLPVTIGEAHDNHGGPAVTVDSEGYLHVVYFPHHHAMRYRRSKRPNETVEWEDEIQFGERLTYPTLMCGPDNTLLLTARRSFPGDKGWEVELWKKAPAGSWRRIGSLLRSRFSGYAHFQESLAWGPDHRSLHLCCRFHEDTDGKAYGRRQTVAYLVSDDAGESWRRSDGTPVDLPANAETAEVLEEGGLDEGRILRVGGMAVDAKGVPWLVYSETLAGRSRLFLAQGEGSGRWRRIDLSAHLPNEWREWDLIAPAGVTWTQDGSLTLVGQLIPRDASASGRTWGHPGSEVVRFRSADAGKTFGVEVISAANQQIAHWLPNLERATGHHAIPEQPGVLFTRGGRGANNVELMSNEVHVLPNWRWRD